MRVYAYGILWIKELESTVTTSPTQYNIFDVCSEKQMEAGLQGENYASKY